STMSFLLPSRAALGSSGLVSFLDAFLLAGLPSPFVAGFVSFFWAALLAVLLAAFFSPCLALCAPFLLLASFVQEACSGATCAPCCATVAVSVVLAASAFVMVLEILSALGGRTTIHH